MKKKEIKTLREKEAKELVKQVAELKAKVMKLQPKITVGQEQNVRAAKMVRRDIAQLLGIIREKEANEGKQEEEGSGKEK